MVEGCAFKLPNQGGGDGLYAWLSGAGQAIALQFVDADQPKDWLKVGHALWSYAATESWSRKLWDAWSGGGEFRGLRFPGSSKFDPIAQDTAWEGFHSRENGALRRSRISTIYWLANRQNGTAFQAATKHLGRLPKFGARLSEEVKELLALGRQFPKGNEFHQAREAHFQHFVQTTRSLRLARLLHVIQRFINFELGVAWPGVSRIAARMSLQDEMDCASVRELLRELAKTGYVRMSDGRSTNPDGVKGSTYVLVPPLGMTWHELIAWDRKLVGHQNETAWRVGSEPVGPSNGGTDTQVQGALPDSSEVGTSTHVDGGESELPGSVRAHTGTTRPSDRWASVGEGEAFSARSSKDGLWHSGPFELKAPPPATAIPRWVAPGQLPPSATRLLEALKAATQEGPQGRWLQGEAENVAQLLSEVAKLGITPERLERELRLHEGQVNAGLRDNFRPKRLIQLSKAGRKRPEEYGIAHLHYLLSIADRLMHIARGLERYQPAVRPQGSTGWDASAPHS
jgi:hypothetical protein